MSRKDRCLSRVSRQKGGVFRAGGYPPWFRGSLGPFGEKRPSENGQNFLNPRLNPHLRVID